MTMGGTPASVLALGRISLVSLIESIWGFQMPWGRSFICRREESIQEELDSM